MLLVADVMTTKLITLSTHDTLKTAREIMQKARIRPLPSFAPCGCVFGLLAQLGLFRATISHFAEVEPDIREQVEAGIPISEIMEVEGLTVPPDMPLPQAGELMLAHKFGCLPVLERGQLRGILTESDFVKLCLILLERPDAGAKSAL